MKEEFKDKGLDRVMKHIVINLPKSHVEYDRDFIIIHDLFEKKKYKLTLKVNS